MFNNPTSETYDMLNVACATFNQELFGGILPPCLITFQRCNRAYGYFSGARFAAREDSSRTTDEIALNPTHFAHRSVEETLSTLVHEMTHQWQHHFGTPSRSRYHNREWAAKMEEVGLIPSHTGQVGGARTGQQMTHYIDSNGRFTSVCEQILKTGATIAYADRAGERHGNYKKKLASKTKYTCPQCGLNAWAKADATLMCGVCRLDMLAALTADPPTHR